MNFSTFKCVTALGLLFATGASAAELKIGLANDPDVLDPAQSRTFVGRIVYTAMCDKLVDVGPDLQIVPQLATEWKWSDDGKELNMKLREGVKFHDGTPFNAEAVIATIDRNLNLPESRRKSELASIEKVEKVSDLRGQVQAEERRCHLARATRRPRRHDRLAHRRQRTGRQFRQQAGLRRPVQIRRARYSRTASCWRSLPGLLEQGQYLHRQGHLPADPRHDCAPRQPARRRSRHGRPTWRPAMLRRSRTTPT